MNFYSIIYYHMFQHCVYLKKNVAGTFFKDPAFDSVLLLSFLESFNVITLVSFFAELPLTTTLWLDIFLGLALLLGINSLYFLRKKRYINIVYSYQKNTTPDRRFITSIIFFLYVVTTFVAYWRIMEI